MKEDLLVSWASLFDKTNMESVGGQVLKGRIPPEMAGREKNYSEEK